MIEFVFDQKGVGPWTRVVMLTPGMTGGEAFELAVSEYQRHVFTAWRPGHPDVTITITGK